MFSTSRYPPLLLCALCVLLRLFVPGSFAVQPGVQRHSPSTNHEEKQCTHEHRIVSPSLGLCRPESLVHENRHLGSKDGDRNIDEQKQCWMFLFRGFL
jgi:hypothetical protein